MSDSLFFGDRALRRRAFLQVAGASAATATLVLAGCGTDDPQPVVDANVLRLGNNDAGLLNYIYLFKQLKRAFYKKIVDAPPSDLRAGEKAFFDDLHDHELVHRETLRFLLNTSAYDKDFVQPLAFDFSTLTLTTRAGVLAAAQQLEDLSVAAFAGLLRLVNSAATSVFLIKMASVNARQAAFVHDLLTAGTFADDTTAVVSGNGLLSASIAKTPPQVIEETKAFFLPVVINTDLLPKA